jgi:hypothetical protein
MKLKLKFMNFQKNRKESYRYKLQIALRSTIFPRNTFNVVIVVVCILFNDAFFSISDYIASISTQS